MKPEWQIAEARIVSCNISWLQSLYTDPSIGSIGNTVYVAEYEYSVDGVTYRRSMRVGSPRSVGDCFELGYDARRPGRNAASDQSFNLNETKTWIGIVIGILLAAVLAYWETN